LKGDEQRAWEEIMQNWGRICRETKAIESREKEQKILDVNEKVQ